VCVCLQSSQKEMCLRVRGDAFVCVFVKEEMCWRVIGDVLACERR